MLTADIEPNPFLLAEDGKAEFVRLAVVDQGLKWGAEIRNGGIRRIVVGHKWE
jgi:hypothetical protein